MKNRMHNFEIFALSAIVVFVGLISTGCSGGLSNSNIQIQFPDWQSKRASDLQRRSMNASLANNSTQVKTIAINITGAGISPVQTFFWERSNNSETPPSNASFTIPKGSSRLFQVMAIYDGGGPEFYYGETTQDISSDTSVDITVSSVAAANSGVHGKILGRYLRADQTGPTGVYQYRFVPPSGSPSMIVSTGEMFNGWVKLFALDTPLIQYTRPDGTALFNLLDANINDTQPNNASNLFFRPSTIAGVARVDVPAGYYFDKYNSSGDQGSQDVQRYILGFFGPGTSLVSRKLCFNQQQGPSVANYFESQTSLNPIYWYANSTSATGGIKIAKVPILGTMTNATTGTFYPNCTNLSLFDTALVLDETKLGEGENALGINPPFAILKDNDSLLTSYNPGANSLTVSWKLLPGVTADVTTIGVFYRLNPNGTASNNDDIKGNNDGYNCNGLTSLSKPFTEVRAGSANSSLTIPGVNATLAGQMQIVVCPFDSSRSIYFNSGTSTVTNSSNQVPTLALEPAANYTNTILTGSPPSSCYPFQVTMRDRLGNLVSPAAAITGTLAINGSSGGLTFYSHSDCSGSALPTAAPFTISAGSSTSSPIYANRVSGDGMHITISLMVSNVNANISTTSLYSVNGSTTPSQLVLSALTPIVNECTSLDVSFTDSYDHPQISGSDIPLILASQKGVYFADSLCKGLAISQSVIKAGSAVQRIYYMGRQSTNAATSESISIAAGGSGIYNTVPNIAVGSPDLTHYEMSLSSSFSTNYVTANGVSCAPITILAKDEAAYSILVHGDHQINLTTDTGFFSTGGCPATGPKTMTVPISSGSRQSNQIYFTIPANVPGAHISGVDASDSSIILSLVPFTGS